MGGIAEWLDNDKDSILTDSIVHSTRCWQLNEVLSESEIQQEDYS